MSNWWEDSPLAPEADKKDEWWKSSPVAGEKSSAVRRVVGDTGVSLLKGAISVPEAVVGIGNLATGGYAGKAAEAVGFRPKEAKATLDTLYSPEQQAANRAVHEANGFLPTIGAAIDNPSVIAQTAAESLPSMLAGGVVGRGVRALGGSSVAAGGIGEGAVGAGLAAEGIRQQTADGTLSPLQSASALASGIGTGLLGAAGGKAAQKLGLSDVDTMLAGGAAQAGSRSLPARVAGGALAEGVLEELPQSMQEQAWQNVALGRPVGEGVAEAGALGALVGGVMGAGGGVISGPARQPETPPAAPPIPPPVAPSIAGLLPNIPNRPMVVFPDGSTMSGAEAERYRLDQMVRPADAAPPSISGLLPHVPGSRDSETLISFPDGSTGTRQQFDEYIASLPENQRTAEMGSMLYGSGGPLGKTLAAGPIVSPVVSPTDRPEGVQNAGTSGPLAETLAEGSQAASPVGIGSLAPASVPADGSDAGQGVGRGAQGSASGGKSPVASGSVGGQGVTNPSTILPPAPAVSKAPAAPAPQQQPGSAVPPSAVAAGAPIQQSGKQPAAPDVITLADGRPYVSEATAKQGAKKHGVIETHAVEALPNGQGFVLRRKAPTQEQSNAQAAQAEPQQTQREETPAAGAVGNALRQIAERSAAARPNHPSMPVEGTADGTFAGSGSLNVDSDGNVILHRVAGSRQDITKSGNTTATLENLLDQSTYHGGGLNTDAISTSGNASFTAGYGLSRFGDSRTVGTFKIPLNDLLSMIDRGEATIGNLGEGEILLSGNAAAQYLAEIDGEPVSSAKTKGGAAPAASAAPSTTAPSLVQRQTLDGRTVTILAADSNSKRAIIPVRDEQGNKTFDQAGAEIAVKREQLAPVATVKESLPVADHFRSATNLIGNEPRAADGTPTATDGNSRTAPMAGLERARKNNTFTGQASGAGRSVGMTQPKGTPTGNLFANFADDMRDRAGKLKPHLAEEVDSVMAEEAAPTGEAAPAANLPPAVKRAVANAIDRLRGIEDSLANVERARGKGYNLATELRDRQDEIRKAQGKLQEFRMMAESDGVDADAVIAELGGEPDFSRFGEPAAADSAKEESQDKTRDAGAELTANRRNKLNRGLTWADIADKDEALRVKEATKQKVYPRPDYQALIDGGMEPAIAHIVKQVYDSMTTAPKTRATPTDADIQAFIAGVNRVMDGAMSWANDAAKTRAFVQKVASRAAGMVGAMRGQPVALSSLGGSSEASLLDTVYPDGWKAARSEITLIGGNKVLGALQPNTDEMIAAMKAVEKGWPAAQEAWQKRGYQVVSSEGVEPSYYEGKRSRDDSAYVSVTFKLKVGRLTRNIDQILVEGSDAKDAPEVRKAVADRMAAISGKMLLLDKSGHLASAHDTQEAAEEAARELTKRDGKTTVSDKGIRVEAAERIGPARRMEGEDVSSEMLRDTFKFKGVNFGNWMKGDANAKERQLHVNHAYDAFLDLADIMGVPPEAMSLNGMLGLAIGAQGGGGKMAGAAHFVPGVNEINLTRESGAGSLAHEWAHAVDHYFARLAGLTRETEPFLTEHANRHMTGEIRPEVVAKFKAIVEAMNRRPITPAEAAEQQHAATEKSRKNVESWLKAIRRDFESGAVKPGTPNHEAAKKAAIEAFDVLAERVRTLNLGDGKVAASSTTALSPAVSLMRDVYKENFGRTYSIDNLKGLQANIDSLAYRVAAKDDAADHVPQMTGTNYAANARKLDGDKGGKAYWSTNLEKFARAFDAFVSDELEAKAAKNTYLSHAGRTGETVPEGAERTAINKAFAELVQTIETKTDDAGNVAMFSRSGYNEIHDLPENAADNRTLDGTELQAVRRAAARLERPDDGVFLRVTEDGRAIATGPKGVRVPPRYLRFAQEHDLAFTAQRTAPNVGDGNSLRSPIGEKTQPMPEAYREGGALYFAEMAQHFDRTGKSRFSRSEGQREAGQSVESARTEIAATIGKPQLAILERKGMVKIHADINTMPIKAQRYPDAWGYFDGATVHLVAGNLAKGQAAGVFAHEFWHRMLQGLKLDASPLYGKLMERLGKIEKNGAHPEWFRQAQSMIPQEDRGNAAKRLNETAAYAIQQYEADPKSLPMLVRKWAQDMIAAVRAFFMEAFGFVPKNLTAADLAALTRRYITATAAGEKVGGPIGEAMAARSASDGQFSRAERTDYGRVIVNPSEDQLRNLIASSSEQELRGLRIDGELYVWDAANAIHSQMQRELGLSGAEQVYFTADGEQVRESSATSVGEASADEYRAAGGMFSRPGIATRFTQSSTETSGESGREYSAAQREMFVRVGRTVEKPSLKDRLKAIWKDAGKRIAQGMVDQFRPLRELGGQAYLLARLSKGTEGAIDAFLHHGKLKLTDNVYDADTSGGAIEQVFQPLQGEGDDFLWWVASNRAARLSAEDRENLFTKEDIAAGRSLADGDTAFEYTLADGSKTKNRNAIYRDALKKFDGFNKNALDIAEKSGLIDGESRKYWEHEFYVPFYRVNDEEGGFSGAHVKKGLVRQEAFKQLKGGANKLNADLLENTLQNWAHLIDASAKNRAAKATLTEARKMGIARLARQGEKDAVWYMGEVTRNIPKGTEYEDGGVTKVSDGTATIREHGKVNMLLEGEDAPYIMEAITSLQYAGLGSWAKPLTAVKHWLTIGVTASPAFKLRNLIRDSVQAIGTADLSYNPARNLKEGFQATRRDTQKYVSMLASGALIRFGTMEGEHAQKIRRLVSKGVDASTILDSPNKLKAFYGKYLEPGVDAYNELGNRGEEINRAALYEQLMAKGMGHAEAALLARDLMDFSMQGTWAPIRFLTQVVPFMNARMQGLYKLGRASAQDKRRFATVVGAVALFSVMLMLAYEDDDDWKKREDWDRDNNWWFKLGGVAFRVPKPFEIGTIGTLAERGVELFASDEMTGKRFMGRTYHMLADTLAMNPVPQLFKPVIDLYANKNSFTGRPIETMGMERLLPEYRFTSRTTLAARAVSTAGNTVTGSHFLSPVQVDHLVQGYFSWLGSFATGTVDRFTRPLTDDPAQPTEDYWKTATAGFLSSLPAQQSRYVSQMYEQARVLEQAHGTYQHLLKTGRMDEAQAFRRENAEALAKYRTVEHIKKIESQINQRIRKIENSDLTADQKRNLIDIANRQKDAAARRVPAG